MMMMIRILFFMRMVLFRKVDVFSRVSCLVCQVLPSHKMKNAEEIQCKCTHHYYYLQMQQLIIKKRY